MPALSGNDPPIDLGRHLGASAEDGPRTQRFTIYIPDRDQDNKLVPNIRIWIEAGMALLTEINGGCTRVPNTTGQWKSTRGTVVKERTALIYSYFQDFGRFEAHLPHIREFIFRFGKETNQGSVMVELFGEDAEGLYSRAYMIPQEAWQD